MIKSSGFKNYSLRSVREGRKSFLSVFGSWFGCLFSTYFDSGFINDSFGFVQPLNNGIIQCSSSAPIECFHRNIYLENRDLGRGSNPRGVIKHD